MCPKCSDGHRLKAGQVFVCHSLSRICTSHARDSSLREVLRKLRMTDKKRMGLLSRLKWVPFLSFVKYQHIRAILATLLRKAKKPPYSCPQKHATRKKSHSRTQEEHTPNPSQEGSFHSDSPLERGWGCVSSVFFMQHVPDHYTNS